MYGTDLIQRCTCEGVTRERAPLDIKRFCTMPLDAQKFYQFEGFQLVRQVIFPQSSGFNNPTLLN